MKTLPTPVRLLLIGTLLTAVIACDRPQIDPTTDSLIDDRRSPTTSSDSISRTHRMPQPGKFNWDSVMIDNPTDTILMNPVDRPKIDPQPVQVYVR